MAKKTPRPRRQYRRPAASSSTAQARRHFNRIVDWLVAADWSNTYVPEPDTLASAPVPDPGTTSIRPEKGADPPTVSGKDNAIVPSPQPSTEPVNRPMIVTWNAETPFSSHKVPSFVKDPRIPPDSLLVTVEPTKQWPAGSHVGVPVNTAGDETPVESTFTSRNPEDASVGAPSVIALSRRRRMTLTFREKDNDARLRLEALAIRHPKVVPIICTVRSPSIESGKAFGSRKSDSGRSRSAANVQVERATVAA